MATTQFSTSDVQTRKAWALRVQKDTIADETLAGQMISDGSVILQTDLSRDKGDQVKYHLLARDNGLGLIGDQSATGNEGALTYHQDTVTINELRRVIRIENQGINNQRVTFDMPEDTYQVLKNWFIERMAAGFLNQLAGFTSTSFSFDGTSLNSSNYFQLTGMNACTAPTRIFRANSLSTDEALQADTTAKFSFRLIDLATKDTMVTRPYIMPLKSSSNGIKYKCYVHPAQWLDLIQDTTAPIQFRDLMLAKITSGKTDEALIGQYVDYNQTRIIVTDKVPNGVHSSTSAAQTSVRRAVFVGAEAGACAFGKGFTGGQGAGVAGFKFTQDFEDVEKWTRIGITGVWGMEKTQFNSVDRAAIVLASYAA